VAGDGADSVVGSSPAARRWLLAGVVSSGRRNGGARQRGAATTGGPLGLRLNRPPIWAYHGPGGPEVVWNGDDKAATPGGAGVCPGRDDAH
jgi:hypothetical protein